MARDEDSEYNKLFIKKKNNFVVKSSRKTGLCMYTAFILNLFFFF